MVVIGKPKNIKQLLFLARLEHDFRNGLKNSTNADERRDFSEALKMIDELREGVCAK